eukprot:1500760-Pyramimonas_sp.AAC.1
MPARRDDTEATWQNSLRFEFAPGQHLARPILEMHASTVLGRPGAEVVHVAAATTRAHEDDATYDGARADPDCLPSGV